MRRSDHELIVRELRKVIEAQSQEIRELRDRLMYASGKPWTPPPLDPAEPEPELEHEDPDLPGYTSERELVGL